MNGGEQHNSGGLVGAFSAHRSELLRFLCARCGTASEAEDFLQELWLKLSSVPPAPIANARAYLFRMANNLVLDQRRARHRAMARDRHWLEADGIYDGPPEDRPDGAKPADETLVARQEAEVLHEAICALPPGAQHALRLFRFEDRSQAEIATIMGISRSGVEKHLATAMKHLRHALSDCGFLESAAFNQEKPSRSRDRDLGIVP